MLPPLLADKSKRRNLSLMEPTL